MWAGAHERWERGVGGRIDDAQDSPERMMVSLMVVMVMIMVRHKSPLMRGDGGDDDDDVSRNTMWLSETHWDRANAPE